MVRNLLQQRRTIEQLVGFFRCPFTDLAPEHCCNAINNHQLDWWGGLRGEGRGGWTFGKGIGFPLFSLVFGPKLCSFGKAPHDLVPTPCTTTGCWGCKLWNWEGHVLMKKLWSRAQNNGTEKWPKQTETCCCLLLLACLLDGWI